MSNEPLSAGQTVLTRDNAAPVGDNRNSQTAGPTGPDTLQDVQLVQKLQRFNRERIPERVVHARGTGVHGHFVATADISHLTRAAVFAPGKRTPAFVRFSTVIHPAGSPETLRDPRGFATKFYTDEGNWDLVGLNLPVFFIRDAIKFPDIVHSFKPSPVRNVQDPERIFDFLSHVPEVTHILTRLYTDLGIPASYRKMDGYSVHAYKFVDAQGRYAYVKFRWKSLQGVATLDIDQAADIQGKDFNNLTNDLYRAIAAGEFPQWDLYIQVLQPSELNRFYFDPLDATKIWPDVPEQKIGTLTLDRVPDNFFEATEQVALSPANLVPGIEPSEDRLLQGRIFAYSDTQLYRLGANHSQFPVNRPIAPVVNYNQNGAGDYGARSGEVNYEPSHFSDVHADPQYRYSQLPLTGTTRQEPIRKRQDFQQAGDFYRSLSDTDKAHLVRNLSGDLRQVTNERNRYTILSFLYRADPAYGTSVAQALGDDAARVKAEAAHLED
ncbi:MULTISPECIES: catalase [unclassified Burkholderia]|uniref:catalase n=1 Tax=unclassified Burkholderia TaxID=2613784 RepID=UPI0007538E53|nr:MULTISPECIES: catalase [unclassified Burkholderia]KVN06772.1 catalase [Burkholderia sp. MSMB1552]KWZ50006.1 catalase [Burkholderia sp. MSMB1588]